MQSGLARAFFYAGARSLLVSHWRIDSKAATRLTTSTFDIMRLNQTIGRAEALRRAMLAYDLQRTNGDVEYLSDPFSALSPLHEISNLLKSLQRKLCRPTMSSQQLRAELRQRSRRCITEGHGEPA